jgi:hypothetical protein
MSSAPPPGPASPDSEPPLKPAARLGRVVFGDRKDPLSPTIFHQVSLMAFLRHLDRERGRRDLQFAGE